MAWFFADVHDGKYTMRYTDAVVVAPSIVNDLRRDLLQKGKYKDYGSADGNYYQWGRMDVCTYFAGYAAHRNADAALQSRLWEQLGILWLTMLGIASLPMLRPNFSTD